MSLNPPPLIQRIEYIHKGVFTGQFILPVVSASSPLVLSVLVASGPGPVAVSGLLPAPTVAAPTGARPLCPPRHLLPGSAVPFLLGDREEQPLTLFSLP
jgi:hypothetical protein